MWLSVCSEVQMICVWSISCHCCRIVSCFIKIQIGLTFLVLAYPECPGKQAVKQVSVYGSSNTNTVCENSSKGIRHLI